MLSSHYFHLAHLLSSSTWSRLMDLLSPSSSSSSSLYWMNDVAMNLFAIGNKYNSWEWKKTFLPFVFSVIFLFFILSISLILIFFLFVHCAQNIRWWSGSFSLKFLWLKVQKIFKIDTRINSMDQYEIVWNLVKIEWRREKSHNEHFRVLLEKNLRIITW